MFDNHFSAFAIAVAVWRAVRAALPPTRRRGRNSRVPRSTQGSDTGSTDRPSPAGTRGRVPGSGHGGHEAGAGIRWNVGIHLVLPLAVFLSLGPNWTALAQEEEMAIAPSAPQNLTATPGSEEVILTWEAPADDGGADITGYRYRHAEGSSVPDETEWTDAGTDLSVTVDELDNGTAYTFQVSAVNQVGQGDWTQASATPERDPVVTVYLKPGDYRFVEGASDAGVEIVAKTASGVRRPSTVFYVSAVTKPVSDSVGSPADYATVSQQVAFEPDGFEASSGAWSATKTVALTIHDDGESENDEIFNVLLQMAPGEPSWVHRREPDGTTACPTDGCAVAVTIAAHGPPTAPQNLSATPGEEQVALAWEAPEANGVGPVSGYQYRHAEGTSVPESTTWNSAGDVLTIAVETLEAATEYAFEVRAVNEAGSGETAAITATTDAPNSVPTAANGTVSAVEDTTYVFAIDDFGFSDMDADDVLVNVTVVTLPLVGTLELGGKSVALNEVVAASDLEAGKFVFVPVANGNGSGYASYSFKVSDGSDVSSSSYSMTIDVSAVNDPATGAPTISGTAEVGHTLSAETSGIGDIDGLPDTFTYQWIRVDGITETDIPDATSSTYSLRTTDAGKTIKVKVSFTDNDNSRETRSSSVWPAAETVRAAPGEPCAGEEDSIRLAGDGSRDANEGRVEICTDNDTTIDPPARWGTICDDYWTQDDADVACQALGFAESEPYAGRFLQSTFGAGDGPIWLDDMVCSGNETNLLECMVSGGARTRAVIGVHNCKKSEIVGIRCRPHGAPELPHVNGNYRFSEPDSNGQYRPGSSIEVTVPFSEAVVVNTAGGTPTIDITIGDTTAKTRTAEYRSGSGSSGLVFAYRIASGDGAFRRVGVEGDSLKTNGGTIRSEAGVDAVLWHWGQRHKAALPELSVLDTRASEGGTLVFQVTLSWPADFVPLKVVYETGDGTATAGDDYVAASGTVAFGAGETRKTVEVEVLDDSHDEQSETMYFTVLTALGARITDRRATGTITNTDPMPRAWLARFGRTVGDQVSSAVEERLRSPGLPGTDLRVAGHRVASGMSPEQHEARKELAHLEARSRWLRGKTRIQDGDGTASAALNERDVLARTSFAMAGDDAGAGAGTLWGQGAVSRFDGVQDGLEIDGDVASAILAADWTQDRKTAGIAVAQSWGEGGYRAPAGGGRLSSTVTGVYPYGGFQANEHVSAWGVAGRSEGTLTLKPNGAASIETGMDLTMIAAGIRRSLVNPAGDDGVEVAVAADGMAVRTRSESAQGPGGNLAGAVARTTRVRLGLEGTWHGIEAAGGAFVPTMKVALRHDGGDAETGFGSDVGAEVSWTNPGSGIEATVRGHGLLTHEDGGFREHSLAGSLTWDPEPDSERGPRFSLIRSMGSATGGAEFRPGLGSTQRLADIRDARETSWHQLEATLGYGLPVFGERFIGTPEIGFGFSDTTREFNLGWRLGLAKQDPLGFELLLEGTRRAAVTGNRAPEHGIALRLHLDW